ncbi:MAG: hypothetical protein IPN47_10255 [Gemmatimonadetes bacterium]|nr:hypothetical protein [Gemmatimonadota bacterium]
MSPAARGANILLAYVVLKALFPLRTARLVVLLLAASPWSQFAGPAQADVAHLHAHLHVLLASAGSRACTLQRHARHGGGNDGTALGMMSLIRPLDAAIVAGLYSASGR